MTKEQEHKTNMSKEHEHKTSADERQNFVATRMSLPLFMVSRNRLREDHMDSLHKQFKLAGSHYNQRCHSENRCEEFSAATYRQYRHVAGFDKAPPHVYPQPRPLHCDRSMTTWRGYQQAPNRYGVLPVPYQRLKGSQGAVFAKMHTNKSRVSIKPPPFQFYDTPSEIDRLFRAENKQKGIFLTNAREHRPCTRNMVMDLNGCWRDPQDPGPVDTYYALHQIKHEMHPITTTPTPNPHLFLRNSSVPTKRDVRIRRNISFEPGPGRYDIRFPNMCPCARGRKIMPRLSVLIDKQKRFKFRRLPYKPIKSSKYCEPDWQHVVGKGHKHIFMMGKHDLPQTQYKKLIKSKKTDEAKPLKMFADGKYLNMLVNPVRWPISTRDFPVPPYVPKIVYNSIAKRVIRKQLRNNKKIAFNSGQERWTDGPRVIMLTQSQLEELKMSLPEERRLYDHPMQLRESRMVSRLHHVPEHMKVRYQPKLRKRLFKFLPIPGARVLVTDSDIRPDLVFDPDNPTGFYNRKIDEKEYYRDSVLAEMELEGPEKPEKTASLTSLRTNRSVVSSMSGRSVKGSKVAVTLLNPSEERAMEEKAKIQGGD